MQKSSGAHLGFTPAKEEGDPLRQPTIMGNETDQTDRDVSHSEQNESNVDDASSLRTPDYSDSPSPVAFIFDVPAALQGLVGKHVLVSPMRVWRVLFYLLMCWHWNSLRHGPMGFWEEAFVYDHTEWLTQYTRAVTELHAAMLRFGGAAAALLAIRFKSASILFALVYANYLFSSITNFVNHHYLFFLLSVLTALFNTSSTKAAKRNWVHAMRSQIVVVYFYASLWKLHPDWLDGSICKGIFVSFEDQGVARGLPWKSIHSAVPWIFQFIAVSGFVLDTALFFILAFLPAGNKLQHLSVVFHGFTSLTMSQRIGYSFPIAMLLSVLVFRRMDFELDQSKSTCPQPEAGVLSSCWRRFRRCHVGQVATLVVPDALGLGGSSQSGLEVKASVQDSSSSTSEASCHRRARSTSALLALLWMSFQWAMPLRMLVASGGEFKQTSEGYRFSWTMMLHSKTFFVADGLFFGDMLVTCRHHPFPNPLAKSQPFHNPFAFPYARFIGPRGLAAAMLYTRQLPRIASKVRETVSSACSSAPRVTATVLSSANDGPFVRLVNPEMDLAAVFDANQRRSPLQVLWGAFWDKPADGFEFILRGAGAGGEGESGVIPALHPATPQGRAAMCEAQRSGWQTLVDRAPCMQAAPVRLFGSSVRLRAVEVPGGGRLAVSFCSGVSETEGCQRVTMRRGEEELIPLSRTITVRLDAAEGSCAAGSTCHRESQGADAADFGVDLQGNPVTCGSGSSEDVVLRALKVDSVRAVKNRRPQ